MKSPVTLRPGVSPFGVEAAEPLAALRIGVALLIVISPELHAAPALAGDPFTVLRVPEGLGLLSQVRLGPGVARALEIVATSAGTCAMLGYWSRTSLLVSTLTGGLAFSLSQYAGAVIHDMHLFWFSALLAASRSGDVWSLDTWGRPAPSRTYGVPLAFARALLGTVYFFPGVHKLSQTGLAWFSAESISRELHHKWFEFGEVPSLRPDLHPLLLSCGAVAIVAFELGFGVLAQLRRTRLWAACAGLAFHATTRLWGGRRPGAIGGSQIGRLVGEPAVLLRRCVLVRRRGGARAQHLAQQFRVGHADQAARVRLDRPHTTATSPGLAARTPPLAPTRTYGAGSTSGSSYFIMTAWLSPSRRVIATPTRSTSRTSKTAGSSTSTIMAKSLRRREALAVTTR